MGVSVINPTNGETVTVINMMTSAAWADFLKDMGKTWMTFAPMLTVPICTLGMAVATHSGMLNAALKSAGATANEWKMALIVAFIGVLANLAGDAAFIVFPPLVAMLYVSSNRNPLDGLFLAYGSVSIGFGANLLPGSVDASLAALTEAAAQTLDPSYTASPVMGWYFMFVSTFITMFLCAFVSLKVVEPRLKRENLGTSGIKPNEEYTPMTDLERKALKGGLLGIAAVLIVCAILCLPGLPFQAPEGGTIMTGYLFKCIPTIRKNCGNDQEIRRHDSDDAERTRYTRKLLPDLLLCFPVHLRIRFQQDRNRDRGYLRRWIKRTRTSCTDPHGIIRCSYRFHQPVHGFRERKMGTLSFHLRSDVHDRRCQSGFRTGCIPNGRWNHQQYLPDSRVPCDSPRICTAVRAARQDRNLYCLPAALHSDRRRCLDRVLNDLDRPRDPDGTGLRSDSLTYLKQPAFQSGGLFFLSCGMSNHPLKIEERI